MQHTPIVLIFHHTIHVTMATIKIVQKKLPASIPSVIVLSFHLYVSDVRGIVGSNIQDMMQILEQHGLGDIRSRLDNNSENVFLHARFLLCSSPSTIIPYYIVMSNTYGNVLMWIFLLFRQRQHL